MVLNSILTKEQVNRDVGGSLILHWRPDQIKATVIPILPEEKQIQIQQKVIESLNLRQQSKHLLECAKRAVEIAIEQDEQTAIDYLEKETEGDRVMNITQFTMEEVRCFSGRQEFKIRPLTFLVGENSTGKTTALGCFQVLADYLRGESVHFNSDPYSMGVFRDIVRNSKKKEKAFELGFTFGGENEDIECAVEFAEKKGGFEAHC